MPEIKIDGGNSQPVEMVATKWGWMLCPPGDEFVTGSFKHWGVYSETECLILRHLCKDGYVVMAGGHIGGVAVPIGQVARQVVVCEPQPLLYNLLKANCHLNAQGKVYAYNAALGREEGSIKVPMISLGCKYNMGRFGYEDWTSDIAQQYGTDVEMRRFSDVLSFNTPTLVLLDVEGMELELLKASNGYFTAKGGAALPYLWVECDRPDNGAELIEYIYSMGYTPYWMVTPLTPDGMGVQAGPWPWQCSFNLFCLPKGREWPLGDVPKIIAEPTDPIGNCDASKIIYSVGNVL